MALTVSQYIHNQIETLRRVYGWLPSPGSGKSGLPHNVITPLYSYLGKKLSSCIQNKSISGSVKSKKVGGVGSRRKMMQGYTVGSVSPFFFSSSRVLFLKGSA
jgi:hypothetical protein